MFDQIMNGEKFFVEREIVFYAEFNVFEKNSKGSGKPFRICWITAPMAKSDASVVS